MPKNLTTIEVRNKISTDLESLDFCQFLVCLGANVIKHFTAIFH
jgi:hypothetical protein